MSQQIYTHHHLPTFPGITFRPFAGESDYPKMKVIIDAETEADRDDNAVTLEDIRHDYAHLTHSDPAQDMIFAEDNGQAIAYSRVSWQQEENPDARIYALFVKIMPQYRQQGIEQALIAWCEARLRAIACDHPGDSRRFYQTYSLEQKTSLNNLLDSLGYGPVRYFFEMSRPLVELPVAELPDGVEVRPVQTEDVRRIWEASLEAFRDHWGYVAPDEEDFQWTITAKTFRPELWQVAWAGDQIVGSVLNFIDPDYNRKFGRQRGWTEDISTHRDWRRRGIARALIARSMRVHQEQGMTEVALGVDTQNPTGARHLYEDLGYRTEKTMITLRKPW